MKISEDRKLIDQLEASSKLFKALNQQDDFISLLNDALKNKSSQYTKDENLNNALRTVALLCSTANDNMLENVAYINNFKINYIKKPVDPEKYKSNLQQIIDNGGKGYSHVGGTEKSNSSSER